MAKNDDSKIWAFLGAFLTWLGFLIVYLAKKEDKYAMYYARHGLALTIIGIVLVVVQVVVGVFGALFWALAVILGVVVSLLWIGWLILWLITWIYALSGKTKGVPLVTSVAEKLKF